MHTRADVSKAKEELGYAPKVRFWEGLERTVKWWGLK
jgi:nucleoside-diphosphate-sugar epimerase